jgi:hypothetical protein
LIEQVSQLTKQVELLQFKLDCKSFIKQIEKDDDVCQFYTGVNSHEQLWMIYQWVAKFVPSEDRRVKLNYFEQFVLTLMKLKLNLRLQDLAYRFEIGLSTASRYFSFWIHSLYTCLVPALISWPKRENLRTTLPLCFRDKFNKCNCIIDCFKIFIDRPIQIKERASTYSNYKSHNTAKYLIGIAPQGYISFISWGYGGRSSDQFIVQQSGFIENLEYGDLVLADRGFSIHEAVGLQNAELKILSFLGKKKQLKRIEVKESRDLARVRVHVERVIGAISQRYSILQGPLNYQCLLTDFSTEYEDLTESVVDKMVTVACALYNSCPSVVPLAKKICM